MKKVLLVARDKAPSLALGQLAERLLEENVCFYHPMLGHGEPLQASLNDIRQAAIKVDVVITGMSSSEELATPEVAASEAAIQAGKKVIWYGDLFGTVLRPCFSHMRKNVRMLWVLDRYEQQDAANYYPASTEIVVTGNPAIEQAYFPEWDRATAREKLGASDNDFVLIVPGGKEFEIIKNLYTEAVIVAHRIHKKTGMRFKIFLATHPGDRNLDNEEKRKQYFDLEISDRDGFTVKVLTKADGLPTPKIISAGDGMISSMSTTGIDAAIQRVPVIDIITPYALERFKESSGGRTKWGPGELGISKALYNFGAGDYTESADVLLESVENIFFGQDRSTMIETQKKAYPPITEPVVVTKMLDALKGVLAEI